MRLEYIALRWLLYEKKCHAALYERSPCSCLWSRPDVLGVTKARFLIEVEVKRSLSDFKANSKKHHVRNREDYLHRWPKQFYYFVPEALALKVQPLVPDWAGLAKSNGVTFEVVKVAPDNNLSRRLNVKECAQLFRCQSNQLAAAESNLERMRQSFRDGQWWEEDFAI